MTARSRLISTWIAIWAIVLNALMPTVSLAFKPVNKQLHSASADWVEICTSRGSTWVQLGLDARFWRKPTNSLRVRQRPPTTVIVLIA